MDTLVASYVMGRSYRYGFQGQEKDDEVSGKGNSYTAEFWQYDSRLGRRWNIDPIVKHHESPYAAFANNPILFVDPDGADTLNILNTTGKIDRIKGDGDDVFQIMNVKGEIIDKINCEKGTIQYTWNYGQSEISDTKDLPIDVIQIKGYNQGEKLFKMIADNVNVEFSATYTSYGSSKSVFFTTSHQRYHESGVKTLLEKKLLPFGYVIKGHVHNHPSGVSYPSGTKLDENRGLPYTYGDVRFAETLKAAYKGENIIKFRVYGKNSNVFFDYDEDTGKNADGSWDF